MDFGIDAWLVGGAASLQLKQCTTSLVLPAGTSMQPWHRLGSPFPFHPSSSRCSSC